MIFQQDLDYSGQNPGTMTASLSDASQLLTVREISNYLKVHKSTVYRLNQAGQLPAFRVGTDWRVMREDIDRWRFDRESKSQTGAARLL